jgi:DNA modification methylase
MIKPYYEENGITIYHGDCREILPEIGHVDLIVTDIPFNVNHNYKSYNDNLSNDEYKLILAQWFNAFKIASNAFVVKAPTKTMPIVLPVFSDILGYVWTVIQHSPNATTHGAFNLSLFTQYLIGGKIKQRPCGDFFTNTKNKTISEHPAAMPIEPILKLIQWFSEPTDIICDPFLGGGTTLVAAKQLNRKAIGIEIEEKYCEIAVKRLAQGVLDFAS